MNWVGYLLLGLLLAAVLAAWADALKERDR